MAIKIVQNVNKITPTAATAVQSVPITLKSGYIRVSTGSTGAYVAIGTNPTATVNSFHVPPYSAEVLKETIARQRISGIGTGTSTTISFAENAGNPFRVGDYVSIENAISSSSGINTTHNEVTAITAGTVTLNYNSSSIIGIITTTDATLAKSIKVSALGQNSASEVSLCEIVQLVSE